MVSFIAWPWWPLSVNFSTLFLLGLGLPNWMPASFFLLQIKFRMFWHLFGFFFLNCDMETHSLGLKNLLLFVLMSINCIIPPFLTFISFWFGFLGYGHISPATNTGRAITIIYAIFGIPIFLILLADFGKLFTRGIKFVWAFVRRLYYTGSLRRVRKQPQVQVNFHIHALSISHVNHTIRNDVSQLQLFFPLLLNTANDAEHEYCIWFRNISTSKSGGKRGGFGATTHGNITHIWRRLG